MKRKIETAVLWITAVLFIFFIVPLFVGVHNIGNITGIITCLVVMLFCSKDRKNEMPFRKVYLTVFAAFGVMVVMLTGCMISGAFSRPQAEATVIVLGCGVEEDQPSSMAKKRLDQAITYLTDNPDSAVIVSGGQGSDEKYAEAYVMKNYLIARGIDAERIYEEDQSTSTIENLRYSKVVMEAMNLNPEVVIVTNDFHMYRSLYIAKKTGIQATGLSADSVWWLLPTSYVREMYGILNAWLVMNV